MEITSLLSLPKLQLILWGAAFIRLIIDPFVNCEKLMQGQSFHFYGKVLAIGYLILGLPAVINYLNY